MMALLRGHTNYRVLGRSLQLSTVIRASCVGKLSSMEREVEGTNQVGKDPKKAFEYIYEAVWLLRSIEHMINPLPHTY